MLMVQFQCESWNLLYLPQQKSDVTWQFDCPGWFHGFAWRGLSLSLESHRTLGSEFISHQKTFLQTSRIWHFGKSSYSLSYEELTCSHVTLCFLRIFISCLLLPKPEQRTAASYLTARHESGIDDRTLHQKPNNNHLFSQNVKLLL